VVLLAVLVFNLQLTELQHIEQAVAVVQDMVLVLMVLEDLAVVALVLHLEPLELLILVVVQVAQEAINLL